VSQLELVLEGRLKTAFDTAGIVALGAEAAKLRLLMLYHDGHDERAAWHIDSPMEPSTLTPWGS